QEQKDENRRISKIRVRIEHVVSGVKRYRMVKDRFRNWVRGFRYLVMEIACGLHNLRLKFRPWKEVTIQDF
ncbi:MAG: IS5 family transposase, partial [Desulfamplus sp.]|nr:IS5 family transposase [Desulfamplus sp.]